MQPDDYTRWLEVIAGALAALGAWVWRIAHLDASREARLKALEAWVKDEQAKRSERDKDMFARLENLRVEQAVQGADIKHIASTCNETNAAILEILADRLEGGNRKNDPPRRT